jgi:hypothetical protein
VSLIFGLLWQDVVLSAGAMVGQISKVDALLNEGTTWPFRDSLPNALLFLPSIYAFYTLELYLMAINATLSTIIWFSIAIWRRPDKDSH